jgi:hypothetical protein
MNWFMEFRQAWIKESVEIFGFINREHIVKKFDVSIQIASGDLQAAMKRWPTLMAYNVHTKRYEKSAP